MSNRIETEYGEIPANWKFIRASEYCSKVTDGTHDSPKQQLVGRHLITSKHIKGREIDFENAYLISEVDFEKINKRSYVEQWDVIISMIGEYCGFTYIERNYKINYAVKNVGLFKTGSELKAVWLHYFLNSPIGKYILDMNKSGSSQPYISLGSLRELPILLPSYLEQKAIASVLSSLDDKIDLLHRQNATLEKMAETIFRQWFIEEAKEDWEMRKIGDEFDFMMGASPPGESYNEDRNGVPMYQGNADFGFRFPTNRVFTTDPKRFAMKYDTLISVRAPVGEQNMANEKCCIGRGVAAFRYKNDNSFYSYTFYKMKSLMDEIKQFNETGTVFGSISKSDFETIDISIPDKNSIVHFQSIVKPLDEKIMINQTQIRTLTTLRDTLLPKLMSGEVTVILS